MGIPSNIDQITLDGTVYALDTPGAVLGESCRKKYPQKQFQVEEEGEFWKDWTMASFHGGERLERILTEDDYNSFRYHDAEGLDQALLSKWGEVKLCSSITRSLTIQSASMPMTVSSDGTTLFVGLDESPFVKLWTNAGGWANATAVAGSGTVTDLITAGATLYGVRNGAVITSTDAGANWTAVGSYTTAVGVAYVNGDLFVAKSDGLYNHTDSATITTEPLTVVAGYRENVYAGRDRRLFRYDGRAWYLYDELPMGFNMTALIPYRDVLLIIGYWKIRSGYKSAVYYVKGGGENHLFSVGDYSADWRMYAAAGSDDEIFFANAKRGGADRYDLEVGGITNGPIWGAAGAIPFKSMAVCEGYLFIGRYDNVAGTDGVWRADLQAPTAWKTTGWLTTAEWDFGWSNDKKLFGSVYIEHKALVQGESIDVDYSIDGGTTYYDVGTNSVAGSVNKTFTLDNVTGQVIKLKVTLTGAGTSTPTLKKVVVRAAAMTEQKWMWDLRLLATRRYRGGVAITALEDSIDDQKQLGFTDIDDKSYSVVVSEAVIASDPDPRNESAHISVRLREV